MKRIRLLFDEFGEVTVSHSGGKDSEIIYNLPMNAAEEKRAAAAQISVSGSGREWTSPIDRIQAIMHAPRVAPVWLQDSDQAFQRGEP